MTTPEIAYPIIEKLVHKFKTLSAVECRKMNEDATRLGNILPLFHAMGWDIADCYETLFGPPGNIGRETSSEVVFISCLLPTMEK